MPFFIISIEQKFMIGGLNKKEIFRLEIRKKNIEERFMNARKQMLLKTDIHNSEDIIDQDNSITHDTQINEINAQLIRRSLIKNSLLEQTQKGQLLQKFTHKLHNNPSKSNIEFVVSLCANIILDDISLQKKQAILRMLVPSYLPNQRIFPMIETYFYRNLFIGCYDCLEERQQIFMEEQIVKRMIEILKTMGENFEKDQLKNSRYSRKQIKQSVYENILHAFIAFLAPDIDHNNILLYKLERNVYFIDYLIKNVRQNHQEIDKQLLSKLLLNISSNSTPFQSILNHSQYFNLLQTVIALLQSTLMATQIHYQTLSNTLISFSKILDFYDEENIDQKLEEIIDVRVFTELIRCLYLTEEAQDLQVYFSVWRKILIIVTNFEACSQVIVRGIDLLKDDRITSNLKRQILIFIKDILKRDFKLGSSQNCIFLKDQQFMQIAQNACFNEKNIDICELLEQIENFLDLCSA